MTCAEFERWLDAGSPALGAHQATTHAQSCASCAGALRAARAIDVALRAESHTLQAPPADFVARVMSRVDAVASIAEVGEVRRAPGARTPARRRWLLELASDPVGAVSLTLALAIGLAALWRPDGSSSVASTLVTIPLRWLGSAAVSEPFTAVTRALGDGVDPVVRIAFGLVAGSWILWAAFTIYRRLERVIVLLGRRGGA